MTTMVTDAYGRTHEVKQCCNTCEHMENHAFCYEVCAITHKATSRERVCDKWQYTTDYHRQCQD